MTALHRPGAVAILTASLVAAIACGGGSSRSHVPAAAPVALDPATTGTVSGTVTLRGTPPAAQTVRMDGDKRCAAIVPGATRRTESYLVGGDNTLANVFVYVKSGLDGRSFPIPAEPVVLDQRDCWYVPRVIGVRVGQPFDVVNSDPLLHNVRTNSAINAPFNQGQPVKGVRFSYTFSTEEVMVPVKCDVHAWMDAWVGIVNHPYFAVTGADGRFTLPNLPAGTYSVEAWHEAAGTTTGTVTVTARGTATLDLSLGVPAA